MPDSSGASGFARHYMAVISTALASGDVAELSAMSDPGCGGCRNVMSAIASAAEAGHRVRGAELSVIFAEAPEVRDGETIVDLRYERESGELVDARGSIVSRIPAEGPLDTQLRLRFARGSWSVLGFRQVPS